MAQFDRVIRVFATAAKAALVCRRLRNYSGRNLEPPANDSTSARLHIRRMLPRSVRADFVRVTPSASFADRVRRGLLDEYVGLYRFKERPDHIVSIETLDDKLISESAGQRHILVSIDEKSLRTRDYDGEGRFCRNRRGEVTHFVYYEFGRRMGAAHRIRSS